MENCNHVFIGHADGVTCKRCGLRMTTDEYMAYLNAPEKPKEEPEAPKKPKRARKPKEEPKHD